MKPTVRFFRHDGICRPMDVLLNHLGRSTAPRPGSTQAYCKDAPEVPRPTHRRDEYRPVIPQRVARQHCPPPLHRHAHPKSVPGSGTMNLQRTVNSVLTVCLSPGDHPKYIVNNLGSLPHYYATAQLWNHFRDAFVSAVDIPELVPLRAATELAGRRLKAASEDLIAAMKTIRSELSLRFDLPVVAELSTSR